MANDNTLEGVSWPVNELGELILTQGSGSGNIVGQVPLSFVPVDARTGTVKAVFAKSPTESATPSVPLTLYLSEGRSVTFTGNSAVGGIITKYKANGTVDFTTTLTGNAVSSSYGPYSGLQLFTVTCTSGSIDSRVANSVLGATQVVSHPGDLTSLMTGSFNFPVIKRTYNRPPDVTDNASKGYTINSIWQYKGLLYKPVAAPDATAAAWTVLPLPAGYFTDVAGANTKALFGFGAAKPGYVGKCLELTATIASATVVTDIYALANGKLDNDLVKSILTRADSGTVVTITKIYDQTGNGFDFVKSVSYAAPMIEWDEILDSYVYADVAGNGSFVRTLQILPGVIGGGVLLSGFGVTGNAYTVFAVGRGVNTADSGKLALLAVGDQTNPTTADRRSLTVATNAQGWINISKNGTNQIVSPQVSFDMQPTVVIARCGTDTSVISVNEDSGSVTATNGANDTAVYTGAWLGCIAPTVVGYHCSHRWTVLGIANAALATAQMQTLRRASYARYDIRPQVQDQICIAGDSRAAKITQGNNTVMDNWPNQLTQRIGRDWRVYAFGNSGIKASEILTGTSATLPTILARYKAGARNAFILHAGVNDLSSGVQPSAVVASLQSGTSQAKTAGFSPVILFNEWATTSTSGSANTQMPILRSLIAAQGTAGMTCDYLHDMLQFSPFIDPSNGTYWPDGLHQTQGPDTIIASSLLPLLGAQSG